MLHAEVDTLYATHKAATANGDVSGLLDLFLNLSCDWPVQPGDYGISVAELYDHELRLWRQRANELDTCTDCIAEAQHAYLDVIKLFPYIIAVALVFASTLALPEMLSLLSLEPAPAGCATKMSMAASTTESLRRSAGPAPFPQW